MRRKVTPVTPVQRQLEGIDLSGPQTPTAPQEEISQQQQEDTGHRKRRGGKASEDTPGPAVQTLGFCGLIVEVDIIL